MTSCQNTKLSGAAAKVLAFTLIGTVGQVSQAYSPRPNTNVAIHQETPEAEAKRLIRAAIDQAHDLTVSLDDFIQTWMEAPSSVKDEVANGDTQSLMAFIDSGMEVAIRDFRGIDPQVDELIRALSDTQSSAELAMHLIGQRSTAASSFESTIDRSRLSGLIDETTRLTSNYFG